MLLGFQAPGLFLRKVLQRSQVRQSILSLGGLVLMVVSMALLVAPVMQHPPGRGRRRIRNVCAQDHNTVWQTASLVPLALSLATATLRRDQSPLPKVTGAGALSGLCMGTACALFWFGIEVFVGISEGAAEMKETSTPLKTKVEQLLTEARVIIPGGQALFGSSSSSNAHYRLR